jgi:ADP-ribose pyrophosphatase
MDKLTEFYPSPGFSSEIIHIFKASGLKKVPDADAELPITFVPLNELLTKIRNGEIRDGKTIIGVLMATLMVTLMVTVEREMMSQQD